MPCQPKDSVTKAPAEALSAVGAVDAKAKTARPILRAEPGGKVAMTVTNSKTDRMPLQKLCAARSAMKDSPPATSRLAAAQTTKSEALDSATVRNDRARTKIAAIGMLTTSAIVATQAIHDASSADTEKAPAMSAISRSMSCEEMLDPTMATAIAPIVVIAAGSGRWEPPVGAAVAAAARSLMIAGPSFHAHSREVVEEEQ